MRQRSPYRERRGGTRVPKTSSSRVASRKREARRKRASARPSGGQRAPRRAGGVGRGLCMMSSRQNSDAAMTWDGKQRQDTARGSYRPRGYRVITWMLQPQAVSSVAGVGAPALPPSPSVWVKGEERSVGACEWRGKASCRSRGGAAPPAAPADLGAPWPSVHDHDMTWRIGKGGQSRGHCRDRGCAPA